MSFASIVDERLGVLRLRPLLGLRSG
jgi:hypothetical protein